AHSPDQRPELLGLSLIVSCASGVLLTALSPLLLSLAGVGAPPIYLLLLGNVSVTFVIFAAWACYGAQRYWWGGLVRTLPVLTAAGAVAALAIAGTATSRSIYAVWVAPHTVVAVASGWVLASRIGVRIPPPA